MLSHSVNLNNKTILATGFVGSNLVMEFLRTVSGIHIMGLDNNERLLRRVHQGVTSASDRKGGHRASRIQV